MNVTADIDGLTSLLAALEVAPLKMAAAVHASTVVAANKVKRDARQRISGRSHLPQYPYTISYDLKVTPSGIEAEIGPERGGQGSLGHLIEYGTTTSGPNPHMRPSFDAEVPVWLSHMARIAGEF